MKSPFRALLLLVSFLAPSMSGATAPTSGGPIAPWRGHTQVDVNGVQASHPVIAPTPDERAWRPQWFTAAGADATSTVFLRRDITVSSTDDLKSATARVSADRSYRLWINGELIARGPDDAGSDVGESGHWTQQWLYTTVDLAPYLRKGSNSVAVEVVNYASSSAFSLGKTGLAFEGDLTYANGRHDVLAGPDGWSGIATRAYTDGKLLANPSLDGLRYDASLVPEGWPLSFARQAWAAVTPLVSSWGELRASRIPARMEAIWPDTFVDQTKGDVRLDSSPATVGENITMSGDSKASIHFGRVISAYVSLQVDGAAGTVITLTPRETREQDAPARPVQLTLRDGQNTWESPGYDSFSEVEIQVAHAARPIHISALRAVFTSQPVTYRGSFESSDDHLNALWKAARWQTQISMQDRYLDSPNHQEPIGDPGDYLIAARESDYAFGDPWMAAQNLRQFAALLDRNDEVTFHASYPLFWVQMLLQYYQQTDDKALLIELAPSVDRLLAHLRTYRGKDGLMSEAPNYMFMDWIKVAGYNLHHPPAVIGEGYFSALYYQGLKDGATLSRLTGNAVKTAKYEREADEVAADFNRELWDAKTGLYRDGKPFRNHQPLVHYLPADRDIETHTDQVNIFAVLYGLAPAARGKAIMETLLSRPRLDVQPYFMSFAFDAEAATGLWDRAAWAQMQQWHLNPATGTFREMWFAGDWSHTWGGSPLVQMSSRVLGITPEEPGYDVVRIAPRPAALEWARGVVPTRHGDVSVDWKREDAGLDLTVESPAGVPIMLDLASLNAHSVMVDWHQIALTPSRTYRLEPGKHVVLAGDSPLKR